MGHILVTLGVAVSVIAVVNAQLPPRAYRSYGSVGFPGRMMGRMGGFPGGRMGAFRWNMMMGGGGFPGSRITYDRPQINIIVPDRDMREMRGVGVGHDLPTYYDRGFSRRDLYVMNEISPDERLGYYNNDYY